MKHYRIRQLDDGGFFIARRATFATIGSLVEHYKLDADGLCVALKNPCSQVRFSLLFCYWPLCCVSLKISLLLQVLVEI